MALVDYDYESDDEGEDDKPCEETHMAPVEPADVPSAMVEEEVRRKECKNESREIYDRNVNGEGAPARPVLQHESSPQVPYAVPAHDVVAIPERQSQLATLPSPADLFGSSFSSASDVARRDHSRVGINAQNKDSRKRGDSNGDLHLTPYQKTARGNLPVQRHPPDTSHGLLVPPQLRGRSNVATEDLEKLFVRKPKASSAI